MKTLLSKKQILLRRLITCLQKNKGLKTQIKKPAFLIQIKDFEESRNARYPQVVGLICQIEPFWSC